MITTGIIKEINKSSGSFTNNKYMVEIPLFKKPGRESEVNTYVILANACVSSDTYSPYLPGDKVYVSFINGELSLPVILGKIYTGPQNDFRGDSLLNNLSVSTSAILPYNTKIGNLNVKALTTVITDVEKIKANSADAGGNIEVISADTISKIINGTYNK